MAGASLLLLLDDIVAVLDDVAVMSKVAAKKTAGVLGDDLAVNAEKVTGVSAQRELPVVWAVALGSARNKLILVPAALLISALVPWLITPLLVCGALFLCFEGAEKLWHVLAVPAVEKTQNKRELVERLADPAEDPRALERDKIRGAVRTDFILSAEIIVITLGVVAGAPLATRIGVLSAIAVIMTIGVYGLVAAIIKIDDVGLYLVAREGRGRAPLRVLGRGLLAFAPWLMRALSVVGTAAMFLVGGGILLHSNHAAEHAVADWFTGFGALPGLLGPTLAAGFIGLAAGALVLAAAGLGRGLLRESRGYRQGR
jgi:predicted DNA repair protein MutK